METNKGPFVLCFENCILIPFFQRKKNSSLPWTRELPFVPKVCRGIYCLFSFVHFSSKFCLVQNNVRGALRLRSHRVIASLLTVAVVSPSIFHPSPVKIVQLLLRRYWEPLEIRNFHLLQDERVIQNFNPNFLRLMTSPRRHHFLLTMQGCWRTGHPWSHPPPPIPSGADVRLP